MRKTHSSLSFDNGSRTGYSVKTGGFYPRPGGINTGTHSPKPGPYSDEKSWCSPDNT